VVEPGSRHVPVTHLRGVEGQLLAHVVSELPMTQLPGTPVSLGSCCASALEPLEASEGKTALPLSGARPPMTAPSVREPASRTAASAEALGGALPASLPGKVSGKNEGASSPLPQARHVDRRRLVVMGLSVMLPRR